MELRELRAFVTAAQELHFARAAERLYTSASSMSETIRRLEVELGTPLFTRTTRRITLTEAGHELLARGERILELADEAMAAVHAIAEGSTGELTVGMTPPAAPILAPHLVREFTATSPEVVVVTRRMWLPDLTTALLGGAVDVALTCGSLPAANPSIGTAQLGSEPLLIGLRPDNPLATQPGVDICRLSDQTLGIQASHLFPAWNLVQQSLLAQAQIEPPSVEFADADLSARGWMNQPEIDWIMLTGSFLTEGSQGSVLPTDPPVTVPFTISWREEATTRPVVRRFVEAALYGSVPPGWVRRALT